MRPRSAIRRPAAVGADVDSRLRAFGEERVLTMLAASLSLRVIADAAGVSTASLHGWLEHSAHRRARALDARWAAFDMLADEAERVLREAGNSTVEIRRAAQIAQHLRWRASKLWGTNPATRRDADVLAALRDLDRRAGQASASAAPTTGEGRAA